jgi:hypothetical protein
MIKQFDQKKKEVTDEGYQFAIHGVETFIPQAQKLINELKNDPFRLA